MRTRYDCNTCKCGGKLRIMDVHIRSMTGQCSDCGHCTLIVLQDTFELGIQLTDFHRKRGPAPDKRPFADLSLASRLCDCLIQDEWPSPATVVDFGIASPKHLGALQFAVRSGITAYDLDRVIGDGPAITALVHGIPGQPYRDVKFETEYAAWDWGVEEF